MTSKRQLEKMEPPSVRYTALSYCWGNKDQSQQQLLTTKENLPDRLLGITEQQLTPVLRDAVLATRLLSIRYLWVDSLCILQDDRRDWEHQSAKMDEIYRNAYVTIATPVSGFCGQGFRHATRKKLYISFRSLLNLDVRGWFSVRYLSCNIGRRSYPMHYYDIYHADVTSSRWASLGWTFQENIMSTRLLLFGPAEIFFRCGETTSYLCGHREESLSFKFHERLDRPDWYWILQSYSELYQGLSRSADILPALSGTATAFSRQMQYLNDDYVAGLWKDTLFAGLAWMIADARPLKQRSLPELLGCLESPAIYLSPSWAWPGKGRVEFVYSSYTIRSLLSRCTTQACVTVKGDNPFGEVEDGMVRITGKVAELNSDLVLSEASMIRSLRPWILKSNDGHPWWFNLDWDPWDDLVLRGKLKMVLTRSGIDSRRRRAYFGILIQENKTSPEVRYYRVGSFRSHPVDRHPRNSAKQFFDRCTIQTVDII
jgi:hypothetical protein